MKKYASNEPMGGFSLSGYVEAQVMTEALRRTGKDLTRERFMQTLDQMKDYTGSVLPNVSYSPTDHAGVKTAFLQKAQGGRWVSFTDWNSDK